MRRVIVALILSALLMAGCGTRVDPITRLPANVQNYREEIDRWAAEHDVPQELVMTTIALESCGRAKSESSAGARGLFQVMPFHFEEGEDPFDVETNAYRGMKYLSYCWGEAGGARLTAVCYNAGSAYTHLPESDWPGSTNRYANAFEAFYEDLRDGTDHYLSEWMDIRGQYCTEEALNEANG